MLLCHKMFTWDWISLPFHRNKLDTASKENPEDKQGMIPNISQKKTRDRKY